VLQVRHLWQESTPTFVRFNENAFLCAFKPIFSKKTLAFPCEKWYVVSQRGVLDTRIFRLPAQPGLRPARSVLSVAIFFIYLLIIYPACPQGQKAAAQPARAAVFLFFRPPAKRPRRSQQPQRGLMRYWFSFLPGPPRPPALRRRSRGCPARP